MPKNYVQLEGNNLEITVGLSGGLFLRNIDIPIKHVKIIYDVIRQVYVEGKSVWKNRDSFDLVSEGINPYCQVYGGRGNVTVEFRDDIEGIGIDEIVGMILEREVGLRRVE